VLEKLYDVRQICSAVVKKDKDLAMKLFDEQSSFLACPKNPNIELMQVFLNSLDRGIYNFILYFYEDSLDCPCVHRFCHNNFCSIKKCKCCKSFSRIGEEIICSYFDSIPCQNCDNNKYIVKAKEYVINNLAQPLTLEDVAENVFINKSYLSHLFKRCAGITFSGYVLQQRIKYAKGLLSATDYTVSEIALQCGFSQSSYFATVFKKNTTYTPSEYRAAFSVGQNAAN